MNGEEINDAEEDEYDIRWGVKPMNMKVNGIGM